MSASGPFWPSCFFNVLKWAYMEERDKIAKMSEFALGRVKNIMTKREIAGYLLFSPFHTIFSKDFFPIIIESWDCWRVKVLLTLSQTNPGFYVSAVQVLKRLWEKEKLLMTSNYSFSYSVFYPFGEPSITLIRFEIVFSANPFNLEASKICHFGKS